MKYYSPKTLDAVEVSLVESLLAPIGLDPFALARRSQSSGYARVLWSHAETRAVIRRTRRGLCEMESHTRRWSKAARGVYGGEAPTFLAVLRISYLWRVGRIPPMTAIRRILPVQEQIVKGRQGRWRSIANASNGRRATVDRTAGTRGIAGVRGPPPGQRGVRPDAGAQRNQKNPRDASKNAHFMHLIAAPRNPLSLLASIHGAKILISAPRRKGSKSGPSTSLLIGRR